MKVFIKSLETFYIAKYGEDVVNSDEFYEAVLSKKFTEYFEIEFSYLPLSYFPPERSTNFGGESEYEITWDKSKYSGEENKIIDESYDVIVAEIEHELMKYQE